jgi:8-oxo-dGTP diphosphatase
VGSGDGNAWVDCRCGDRHWGRFGAAGLLLARSHPDRDSGVEVLLQLRAGWTHQGGTWGIPGGASDSHEEPTQSALREAWEETGVLPESVEVVTTRVSADHHDWRYTVVIGRARGPVGAHAANAESDRVAWVPADAVAELELHPGLARSWPTLLAEVCDLSW